METKLNSKGKRFFAPAIAAGLMLAMVLTFSCSSGDDGGNSSSSSGGGNSGGGGTSSSSGGSNSGGGTSSSSNGGGASCGKLMSQNLNADADGSVCYYNEPDNCTKYGKLYDWATAMNLPAKCNETLSTDDPDCAIQSKHRGICPSGQHIPSKEELEEYGSYGCLKNQPGGYGEFDGYFTGAGNSGYWWSSSESDGYYAYYRSMNYDYEDADGRYDNDKSNLYSVRCVQD